MHFIAKQGKAEQSRAEQSRAKQSKAKRSIAKQSKANQSKAKQKAKQKAKVFVRAPNPSNKSKPKPEETSFKVASATTKSTDKVRSFCNEKIIWFGAQLALKKALNCVLSLCNEKTDTHEQTQCALKIIAKKALHLLSNDCKKAREKCTDRMRSFCNKKNSTRRLLRAQQKCTQTMLVLQ